MILEKLVVLFNYRVIFLICLNEDFTLDRKGEIYHQYRVNVIISVLGIKKKV